MAQDTVFEKNVYSAVVWRSILQMSVSPIDCGFLDILAVSSHFISYSEGRDGIFNYMVSFSSCS
jgi:hypothetical protein